MPDTRAPLLAVGPPYAFIRQGGTLLGDAVGVDIAIRAERLALTAEKQLGLDRPRESAGMLLDQLAGETR